MNQQPTLYEKLKPQVLDKLKENEDEYGSTINSIIDALKSTYFVGDLTIDLMRQVHLFSDTSYVDQDGVSILWGEEIFDNYLDK